MIMGVPDKSYFESVKGIEAFMVQLINQKKSEVVANGAALALRIPFAHIKFIRSCNVLKKL